MRLLCLTTRLPYPPNRGDRLRAFHFIRQLSQHHQLTLVSFIAGRAERDHLPALRSYCAAVHLVERSTIRSVAATGLNFWRTEPLQSLYYRDRAMQQLVEQLVADTAFDAAYIHLFRMANYLAGQSDVYRIVDLTDVISLEVTKSLPYRPWLWRFIYRLERPRIARYECRVAQTFEETWLISGADRNALAAICPEANLQVVPNGVDFTRFQPAQQQAVPNSLIFVGHMGVFHNVDAASYLVNEILPLVRQEVPEVKLWLVGAEPSPVVRQLAQPGVEVTGFVPDLNDYLNRAAVFVAPLRFAAGVQNKVLEAMAAARPVITTPLVNEGLEGSAGKQLLLADDAPTFASHIVELLRDQQRREALGQAGRRFVQEKYSWQHVVRRVAAIERKLQG